MEPLYLKWTPDKDYSGRDSFHVLKLSILSSLLNGHDHIELADWEFAVAFMKWQGNIRSVFTASNAKENSAQARLTDKILNTVERKTKLLLQKGKKPEERHLGWRRLAHDGKWALSGVDVARIINQMVGGGLLAYKEETEFDENGKEKSVTDKSYVRLAQVKKRSAA